MPILTTTRITTKTNKTTAMNQCPWSACARSIKSVAVMTTTTAPTMNPSSMAPNPRTPPIPAWSMSTAPRRFISTVRWLTAPPPQTVPHRGHRPLCRLCCTPADTGSLQPWSQPPCGYFKMTLCPALAITGCSPRSDIDIDIGTRCTEYTTCTCSCLFDEFGDDWVAACDFQIPFRPVVKLLNLFHVNA